VELLEERQAPATLTVNSTADTASNSDPYLSLREAIAIFNSPTLPSGLSAQILTQINGTLHGSGTDSIGFDPTRVTGAIILAGTQLELSLPAITAAVTISGGSGVTVDAASRSRVFQVDSGAQATFDHLTVTHGLVMTPDNGGGISNSGTLTVSNSTLESNSAAPELGGPGYGGSGGGIFNTGTLTLARSTINANHAGAGYYAATGGGIYNYQGIVTVSNCTVSSNDVESSYLNGGGAGGGILNDGTLTVSSSLLTSNEAFDSPRIHSRGGGIITYDSATLQLQNTIVAGNRSGGSPDISGAVDSSSSYNLVGIDGGLTGISDGLNHNRIGTTANPVDPLLSALGSYGGPTQTVALLPGSPARNAGDPSSASSTDQRGLPRFAGSCDIGAFQSQANPFLVTALLDPGHLSGQLSLREAVNLANALPAGNTVSFDPGLASSTVTLTAGELLLSRSLAIAGPSSGPLTINGNNVSRVFEVAAGASVSLTSLIVANGQVSSASLNQGGGILNAGNLSLTDCTLTHNQVAVSLTGTGSKDVFARGGGIATSGSLTLLRCTLSANSANLTASNVEVGYANGGGIYNNGGTVSLSNCTLSGNFSTASFGGGAGLVFGYGGGLTCDNGTLTLTGCTVNANQATGGNATGGGGGIHSYSSTVTLSNCTLSSNTAGSASGSAFGGGISGLSGNQTITDCMITNNQVTLSLTGTGSENLSSKGGGLFADSGMLTLLRCTVAGNSATLTAGNLYAGNANSGGLYDSGGTLNLSNCTVSGNAATGTFTGGPGLVFAYGGGLTSDVGTLNLTGCTVAGNTATGGNAAGEGGGVHSYSATVTLNNCTVANNTVSSGGDIGIGGGVSDLNSNLTVTSCTITGNAANSTISTGSGGGFYHSGTGTAQVLNSIVAGNGSLTDSPDANGTFASLGFNLIGIADGSAGWGGSDLTGTAGSPLDPMLGTLGNQGGLTATIPLLAGSPALDAGDPGQLGTGDQRGVVRSGGVNIGAFQASAASLMVSAPVNVIAGAAFDVTVSAFDLFGQPAVGYTGTITFSSGDPAGATLPQDYTFTLTDGGVHTFAGQSTLYTPGTWDVTATDSGNNLVGSTNVNVSGGDAPRGRNPSPGGGSGVSETISLVLHRHDHQEFNGDARDLLA
jgi:hypothetical protein